MSTDKQTKEITVEVPVDRVPEFYAWYGRFLAGRRRGRGHRGLAAHAPHAHAHGCHGRGPQQADVKQD
ncbi:MAG: hypothetical protein NVS1B9_11160 [Solirubrobacteraceae bacterium]